MNDQVKARLNSFLQTEEARSYIEKRQFSEEFVRLTGLSYINKYLADTNFKEETQRTLGFISNGKFVYYSHILFPAYTVGGLFCGFIGRSTKQDAQPKFQLPQHVLFQKETYIHNFHNIPSDAEICFVSENMVEYGRVLEAGFPSVSLNGAYKSKFKFAVLANRFKKIILVADNDPAGQELKVFAKEYLKELGTELAIVTHTEKGLDEYYLKYGYESTKLLLEKYA